MLVLECYKVRTCRPCLSVGVLFSHILHLPDFIPNIETAWIGTEYPLMLHKDLIARLLGETISNSAKTK